MTFEEYADYVTKLASEDSMADFKSKVGTAGLGLMAEAGEFGDYCKKIMYHKLPFSEEVREKMISELSDLCWYMAFACKNVLNITLEEVLEKNMEKLNKRYKTGKFTVEEFLDKETAK